MTKHDKRLHRQFAIFGRAIPAMRGLIDALLSDRLRLLRIPFACLLILGSFLAILPVFGVWMMPLGLLLLAVDVPALRPAVSAAVIRLRRRVGVWRHRRRAD